MSQHILRTWVDEYGFEFIDFKSGIQIIVDTNTNEVVEIHDYQEV